MLHVLRMARYCTCNTTFSLVAHLLYRNMGGGRYTVDWGFCSEVRPASWEKDGGHGWIAWACVIMAGVIGGWLLWRLVSKALERAYDEGWL
jgi:hypothetical protein